MRVRGRSAIRAGAGLSLAVLAGVAGVGCSVGSGSGAASGPLWLTGCTGSTPEHDLGSQDAPVAFQLQPTFFAGVPVESNTQPPANRLTIRMQRNGSATEYNDVLAFDVQSSYEVARCVRGRVDPNTGAPDWDQNGLDLGPWCDWTGAGFATDGGIVDGGTSPDGGAGGTPNRARIRLTSQGYVQASLALFATCPINLLQSSGPALIGHSVDGWIEFVDFGSAAEPTAAAADRGAIPLDFKVNFGERLRATFHVVLEDDRVVTAIQTEPTGPIPIPRMGAVLDGSFDFDLIRARAAQPFP